MYGTTRRVTTVAQIAGGPWGSSAASLGRRIGGSARRRRLGKGFRCRSAHRRAEGSRPIRHRARSVEQSVRKSLYQESTELAAFGLRAFSFCRALASANLDRICSFFLKILPPR